jgi:translocator protein
MPKSFKFIVSFIICQSAGLIGSIFTAPNIKGWYNNLNLPWLRPPNWLFAPVWLTLYTLMAVSLYLIWQQGLKNNKVKIAFVVFIIQLFFNSLWSILFFGWQNPLLGLIDIVWLWLMIVISMILFWPLNKTASLLLVPYFLWVSFATYLNYSIWQLN